MIERSPRHGAHDSCLEARSCTQIGTALRHPGKALSPAFARCPCALRSQVKAPLAAKIDGIRDQGDAVHLSACHAPSATPRSLLAARMRICDALGPEEPS